MKFALNLPNFGSFSDIDALLDLALDAEAELAEIAERFSDEAREERSA